MEGAGLEVKGDVAQNLGAEAIAHANVLETDQSTATFADAGADAGTDAGANAMVGSMPRPPSIVQRWRRSGSDGRLVKYPTKAFKIDAVMMGASV